MVLHRIFDTATIQPASLSTSTPAPSSSSSPFTLISPSEIAKTEKIFFPSRYGECMFCDRNSSFEFRNSASNKNKSFVVSGTSSSSITGDFIVSFNIEVFSPLVQRLRGVRFRIIPQIMLHKNVTDAGIFRSLIVVHRCLYGLRGLSSSSNSNRSEISIFNAVSAALEDAFIFEEGNTASITASLAAAGWDMSKFTFGRISARDTW